MLKRIYLEITNACNLNCDFCIKNTRDIKYISEDDFVLTLKKIKGHTDYIYFHVMGEPLMHPKINNLIKIASTMGFNINITTNGYLINRVNNLNKVRQLNISLHSFTEENEISLKEYLDNIFYVMEKQMPKYVSLRLWLKNEYSESILDYLSEKFCQKIVFGENIKLANNIYLDFFHEYIWPDINNNYYSESGTCYALKDHVGILVDGTVVPCCLDSKGIIDLGNIYKDNLKDILNSPRVKEMLKGFQNNYKCEMLCRHCNFLDK